MAPLARRSARGIPVPQRPSGGERTRAPYVNSFDSATARQRRAMERIEIGMHVDIQRSNGRVHGAVVSELRPERKMVLVEWFEQGETKGKELDLESILQINPTLRSRESTISKNILQDDMEDNDENETLLYITPGPRKAVAPAVGTGRHSLVPTPVAETEPSLASVPKKSRYPSGAGDTTVVMPEPSVVRRGPSPRGIPAPTQSKIVAPAPAGGMRGRVSSSSALRTPTDMSHHMTKSTEKIADDDTLLVTRTKGNTVREIEKMAQEREERRAQQNAAKKQKELEKQLDPGNPNYQFLVMIRDYQVQLDYRPLRMTDAVNDARISVCVRKRPMNKKENSKKEIEVITIPNRDHVIVHQPQVKVDMTKYLDNLKYRFDYTFDENASNDMVYRFTAQPLVRTIFEQGFATCFAYGQTGSGKTHTMGGDFTGKNQNCALGIYALTASDVFKLLHSDYRRENLTVYCSFFEIYGGKVFDLLANKNLLRVLEDGKNQVQVVGLKEEEVDSEHDVLDLIRRGSDVRTAGSTSANSNSSRSHAVFQIILKRGKRLWGKFSLIDLAGNERGQDTGNADRQTRMEGAEINKSLLALKECIRAMAKNSNHIPFRTSKLTLVLRDSFISEKARTCMIAMISPSMASCEHTINTLRYADRVKELGADEGGSSTPMDDEQLLVNGRDDDNDLSLVCRRNGADRETFDMMQLMNNINQAEERTLNDQAEVQETSHKFKKDLDALMRKANDVDSYDPEQYAKASIALFEKHVAPMQDCLDNCRQWLKLLQKEVEMSSKKTSNGKKK